MRRLVYEGRASGWQWPIKPSDVIRLEEPSGVILTLNGQELADLLGLFMLAVSRAVAPPSAPALVAPLLKRPARHRFALRR